MMTTADQDQALLIDRLTGEALAGDKTALWQVLCLFRPRLEAYLKKHFPRDLRPHLEPQDILQDVYFQVFRRIHQFNPRGEDALYRWIVTIARNLLTDALRRRKTIKRGGGLAGGKLSVGAPHQSDPSLIQMLEELAVYHRTPSRSAMSHELVMVMEGAMKRLPPDYREALRLRFLEGLDFSDAGSRMQRTREALQMLCLRALKALRTEMAHMLPS